MQEPDENKITEELLPTKKVRRRKKVLAEKERASIRALYLTLRVIYFSNFSNGFEINQQRFSKHCFVYGTAQTLDHRIVKTVKTFGLVVCRCVPESALRFVSRDGGLTRSRGYLPFLDKRTEKANLKQNHESLRYSPILIVS